MKKELNIFPYMKTIINILHNAQLNTIIELLLF